MSNVRDLAFKHDFSSDVGSLVHLHPTAITSMVRIRSLLRRVQEDHGDLWRGMNRRILREVAQLVGMDSDSLLLETTNFDPTNGDRIFLNFKVDGTPYFFSAYLMEECGRNRVRIEFPSVIYQSERRDQIRRPPIGSDSKRIRFLIDDRPHQEGEIIDASRQGLGVAVVTPVAHLLPDNVRLQFLDGVREGEEIFGEVRRQESYLSRPGWVRVGLDVSSIEKSAAVSVETEYSNGTAPPLQRIRKQWQLFSATTRVLSSRTFERFRAKGIPGPPIRIVNYANERGENIRAIVDSTGDTRGAPVVIIPPAWGKTKESLMPLSTCIVSAFDEAKKPISVVRYDGIRKRGESHKDPNDGVIGSDNHQFSFSQGVRDIKTTLDFVSESPDFRPSKIVLVSFSASSIEARRAVAGDPRIAGWISVVGAPDLQSMMKVISGGIDFAAGMERGIKFGLQSILGIEVDMDYAGIDAFNHSLVSLEDARRDMAKITVPVTWVHGRHDAWMSLDRANDILSRGQSGNRKIVEVPTGHMLRTSKEAIDVFQLVTRELSRMILGHSLPDVIPDLVEMSRRARAERGRRPDEHVDIREFWRDYLLGKDANIGIELMTSLSAFQAFMNAQVEALDLKHGDVVLDLGAGIGSFPRFLMANGPYRSELRVVEIDFVRSALCGSKAKADEFVRTSNSTLNVDFIESDLELGADHSNIPLLDASVDTALASLFLSYVEDTGRIFSELIRVTRPGGRVVVSSLRRDADMSKLYTDGIQELRGGLARALFGKDGERDVEIAARRYLDQASRLLDMEESGRFRFWDKGELVAMMRAAGFEDVREQTSFGDPPQAIIASGRRP